MRKDRLMKKLQMHLSWVMIKLWRILEELFPLFYFYYISNKLSHKLYVTDSKTITEYSKLNNDEIEKRLNDEHERAKTIDEKTSKFTLGLSISLTIISTMASGVVKFLPKNNLNEVIAFIFGLSSLYMISGGLLALGALKTLPKFGYGTHFEINKNSGILISSLIGQEKVNTLRHIRNELSFMSLRNGFLLILISLLLCAFVLYKQITPFNDEMKIELIIYNFRSSLT